MELATGASAGTLNGGIGVEYRGFGTIIVDATANWVISGINTTSGGGSIICDGSLTNQGTIAGAGVYLANGSLTNDGRIIGGNGKAAVRIASSTLINQGTISGAASGIGVYLIGGGLLNYGTIAVVNVAAGSVTNDGLISDVKPHHGGTLIDAGPISGSVNFGSGASKLVLGTGAAIFGGATADAASSNVLELTADAVRPGQLYFGATYRNFNAIIVDAGAQWTFDQSVTLAAGVNMINAGTIIGHFGANGYENGFTGEPGYPGVTPVTSHRRQFDQRGHNHRGGVGGEGGLGRLRRRCRWWCRRDSGVYATSGLLTNWGVVIGGNGGREGPVSLLASRALVVSV